MIDHEFKVLDHGHIALEAVCADDLGVVNAAKVSLGNRSSTMGDAEAGLIRFLMRERHGTPFEHNFFRFRVQAPIFVFREWHRHRIGFSYNERSARYSKMEPLFYVPQNVRTQVGKPGHYTYEPLEEKLADTWRDRWRMHSQDSYELYEEALADGVAKEQARIVLPVNLYSEMIWSCNARSLMAFLSLRNAPTAQWEIQQYAIFAESFLAAYMPVTHEAFLLNDRHQPNKKVIDWNERRAKIQARLKKARDGAELDHGYEATASLREDLAFIEQMLEAA